MTLMRPVGLSTLKGYPHGCDSILFSSPVWQDGKAASCWEKARLPSIHLSSLPCCTWEHWTLFFFSPSGKVGSGVQLLKFLFGPCAQAKGLLWNLSGNFILEVSAQDQWLKRYDCFIAINAWAHVTSAPNRKLRESWLFLVPWLSYLW